VQLTWTAPPDWGGFTPSTEYFVFYYLAGQRLPLGQVRVNGTTGVVTGLTNGTSYEFCVFARAVKQDTGQCSVVTAVLPLPATTTLPPTTLEPTLPSTGGQTGGTALVALLFVLTGGAVLFGVRRRSGLDIR
jgi:LPXTG-motif cell wall-anchored protein